MAGLTPEDRDSRAVAADGGPGPSLRDRDSRAVAADGEPGSSLRDRDSWVTDFSAFGAGSGAMPLLLCGATIGVLGDGTIAWILVFGGLGLGAIGGLTGMLAGRLLYRAARGPAGTDPEDAPYLTLLPLGPTVGTLMGLALGLPLVALLGSPFTPLRMVATTAVPAVSGGLLLGAAWPAYLAVRRRGRPAWPVVAVAVGLSPIAALIGFVSMTVLAVAVDAGLTSP
ncbi:MAG: hypothetical protein R3F61_33680 [Myxococcota bacterium]